MMKKNRRLDAFVEACCAAGPSKMRRRVSRWLKNDYVIQRLREARRDSMNRAIAKLQEAAVQSVDTLCEVQRDGESESARVSAAKAILEQALRATELSDVIERLDAIERTVKSQGFTPGPKISLTYEHERDGKGSSHDGQNHQAPFRGTGGSHEQ
jgi:hypothetical protein